ncbi:hypothetical protein GCM10025868_29050 [Angustibacter aerolatus]|uniref:Integral membrane protein n=1 Tax=Angustibacter aerolatus TaxID=1162965 RepID=A0ABQ6JLJ1_9ACTN|nr:hypothetical protein GCM10025868_29050 [Angustibacter aerolatus]
MLGPLERVAARGRVTRAVRAALALALVGTFVAAVVVPRGDAVLLTVLGLLAALGFAGAVPLRGEPWAWALAPGAAVTALLFVSPFGEPVDACLVAVPAPVTATLLVLAAAAYVLVDVPRLPSR